MNNAPRVIHSYPDILAKVFHSEFSQRLRTLTKPLSQSKCSEVYGYLARDEVVPARLLLGS